VYALFGHITVAAAGKPTKETIANKIAAVPVTPSIEKRLSRIIEGLLRKPRTVAL